MVGASAGTDGASGYVPKPLAGQQTYVLTAAGTWVAGGGGGGGGVWGSIAGTLTDQTDLVSYVAASIAANGVDNVFRLVDSGDATKVLAFELSGITAGTTRTLTIPNASGTLVVGGGTASGTNTGDQTITLTGDVTGSGTGSFATTLASGSASNLNSGTLSAGRLPALTGDVTSSAGSAVTTIATGVVTDVKLANAVKPAVAVVSTANLTLSGEQTIDGVLTSASLVLATGQSTGAQNGPWVSAAGAWARPAWYTSGSTTQAQQFLTTFVRLGTLYRGSTWRMTTAAVIIDTTTTAWVQTLIAIGNLGDLGTGVAAALVVNAGSAGAFQVNNASGSALTALTAANMTAGTFSGSFTTTSWVENTPVITGGLTASGSGANTFAGSSGTFLTSTGAVTIGPGATGFSGITTFTPPVRTSGVASYLTLTPPADTGLTASTESIGVNLATATRTWADGTVALQRERFFSGPTYNKTTTSATFTDTFNLYLTPPVAGTGVTFTRGHTIGIVDATSAVSSITGGLIVATTLGTAATSVGIGGGNVNAGGSGTFGSLSVGSSGIITTGTIQVGSGFALTFSNTRSQVYSSADGLISLFNAGGSNFTRLSFGGETTSQPAIAKDSVGSFAVQSGAGSATFNDAATANSGTVANAYVLGIAAPTKTATGTSVTHTVDSTVYIGGAPTQSGSLTIGTAYALNVAAGTTLLQALRMGVAAPLSIVSGTNQRAGDCTLTGGAVTVNNTTVTANTRVIYAPKTAGGTLGNYSYTVSAATSFTITSSSAIDTSTLSYFLVEVP